MSEDNYSKIMKNDVFYCAYDEDINNEVFIEKLIKVRHNSQLPASIMATCLVGWRLVLQPDLISSPLAVETSAEQSGFSNFGSYCFVKLYRMKLDELTQISKLKNISKDCTTLSSQDGDYLKFVRKVPNG